MRKLSLTCFFAWSLIVGAFAQSPQSFKYQAVVRDLSGSIIANQMVSLKISLLLGTETGLVKYAEIHNGTTNQFGLVTLDIGNGTIETGDFSSINWGKNIYFLKLEIDTNGGTDFVFMGTSQLLSVPYALHSVTNERFLTFTSMERDVMTNVPVGYQFFNTTTNKINYYDGVKWFELTGNCTPTVDQAFAGSDQLEIPGAEATLQGNTPSGSITGTWNIISGTDGYIAEPSNPGSILIGMAGNSYTLSWTLSNSCGSSMDTVVISFAPFTCGQSFADVRNFKSYNSMVIGTQCWMAQNINIGTRIEGNTNMLNNSIIEKYCNSNFESKCDEYGGLYQWSEMMQYSTTPGAQGICTAGWHLPTDDEWKILEGTVDSQYGVGDPIWDLTGERGLDAGGKLKETEFLHWFFPNTGATNSSGFTALGAGVRNTDASFPFMNISGRFWTSNESSSTLAIRRALSNSRADIERNLPNKLVGLSVRCIKD